MTDREMLELAAKAAEIVLYKEDVFTNGLTQQVNTNGVLCWNPLRSDGDALRLAVKLRIGSVHALQQWSEENHEDAEAAWENDPYTATRRAIVRAAAEIGRRMP